MRTTKIFGLVMLAAVATVASISTSPASATNTALCKIHSDPCPPPNLVTSLHLVNTPGTVWELLTDFGNVLCLGTLVQATVGPLAAPQLITGTGWSFTNCGTNVAHDNATVTFGKGPHLTLLRTTLNLATLTHTEVEMRVKATIFGIIKIDCIYSLAGVAFPFEGALHTSAATGHGMVTANKIPLTKFSGVCPTVSSLDFLLEPLEHVFVVS